MTRLQSFLLVVLTVVSAGVFVPLLVTYTGSFFTHATVEIPAMLASIPVWVWWTLFGVGMAFLCPMKAACFGRGCNTRRSARQA